MEGVMVSKSELISERSRKRYDVFMKGVTLGMHKAQRRVMEEIVWGILQSGTVRLSEIGRWIAGVGTRLLSRIKRMSRQLGEDWDNTPVRDNHMRGVGRMIGRETSVVIDTSDIRKDRGFDNKWLFNELSERGLRFLVCGFRERRLKVDGVEQEVHGVVGGLELNGSMYVGRRGKTRRPVTIRYGSCRIVLPEWWDGTRHRQVHQELWLLVVEYICAKRKRLFPILCGTQSELDPDAKFVYYRVLDALQMATAFVLALNLWLKSR